MRNAIGNGRALKAYVLTIDKWQGIQCKNALKHMVRLDVSYELVGGYTIGDPELKSCYCRIANSLFYKRGMSDEEIATYIGHRRIWNKIVEDEPYVSLILEADSRIPDEERLAGFLEDILLKIDHRKWDIIKLFNFNLKDGFLNYKVGQSNLVFHKIPPNGSVGYLIKSEAARKLLRRKHIYRPVDEDLSRPWEFGLRVWSAEANLIDEASHETGYSLLDAGSLLTEKSCRRGIVSSAIQRNLLEGVKQIHSFWYARKIIAEHKVMADGWF